MTVPSLPRGDRGVVVLRALVLVGVVLGDWLATGVAVQDSGHLLDTNLPASGPVAVLFLMGRRERLWRPVRLFALTWALVLLWLVLLGTAPETIGTLVSVALGPLWFVLLCAGSVAVTPQAVRRRVSAIARQWADSVARTVGRCPAWVSRLDRHAVAIFLWHQTALLVTTVGVIALGLHPSQPRPLLLPLFAAVLGFLTLTDQEAS